jgi:hypothetical protein
MSGCCAGVSLVDGPRARNTGSMEVEITRRPVVDIRTADGEVAEIRR